jgi:hypothetical protein
MTLRKIGTKVKLSPKALRIRPDLRGEIGVISYRPITAYPKGYKRGRIMYNVKFSSGNHPRQFGVWADEIQSV